MFSESTYAAELHKMLFDLTWSEKSKRAASKSGISGLEVAMLDFPLSDRSYTNPDSCIG